MMCLKSQRPAISVGIDKDVRMNCWRVMFLMPMSSAIKTGKKNETPPENGGTRYSLKKMTRMIKVNNVWENITPERRKEIIAKRVATRKANKEKMQAIKEEGVRHFYGLTDQIQNLKIKLANLRTMEAMQAVSCALTNKALLPEEDIVRASLPWEKSSGVYFLIADREVVYVGQSVNVYSRIDEHAKGKKFDRYAYVPCPIEMLDKLESLYIHCLRPRLNGSLNGSNGKVKHAPISLELLLGTKENKNEEKSR
jgi:hypothetical protein